MATAYETLVKKHGEERARQMMSERAKKRTDYSPNYFSRLKAEGKVGELKALQAKGVKVRRARSEVE